jgi:hypothetical protein
MTAPASIRSTLGGAPATNVCVTRTGTSESNLGHTAALRPAPFRTYRSYWRFS